jgi:hypothetical protein
MKSGGQRLNQNPSLGLWLNVSLPRQSLGLSLPLNANLPLPVNGSLSQWLIGNLPLCLDASLRLSLNVSRSL